MQRDNEIDFLECNKQGDAYYDQRNFSESLSCYEEALKFENDRVVLTKKALSLIRLGQLEEAFWIIDNIEILVYIEKYTE